MFQEIESDPEEIDTQVILYYLNAERKSYRNVVVLSSYMFCETVKKNKKHLINIIQSHHQLQDALDVSLLKHLPLWCFD